MPRPLFAKGARGPSIEQIQTALRFQPRDIDGDYGNQTVNAISAFQRQRGLPETGRVDQDTWTTLTGAPIPSLFERCLALTAAFEGHGFSLAQANFDGAGITWGVIGFTLKSGSLARVVLGVHRRRPDLVELAFEANTPRLVDLMRAPFAEQLVFADSVSIGQKKVRLAEPWRAAFDLFGKLEEVRDEQRRIAREDYFAPAVKAAGRIGLAAELGIALMFDVHVQNGGLSKPALDRLAASPAAEEIDRRRAAARAVADRASAKFRADVLARKLTVAEGAGAVHGEAFTLAGWGLGELPGFPSEPQA